MEHTEGSESYAYIAALYDHVIPYRDRPDVAFFVEAAQESKGPVLEIGCGTGRVLIPTARAGIDILGLDLSTHMLDVCRQRLLLEAKSIQSRVQLVQADMRSFELSPIFNLATIPFRPFQHLTTLEDQLACLKCIHKHLVKGGKLILDLFNPSLTSLTSDMIGQEVDEDLEFKMPDGRWVVRRYKVVSRDHFNQINQIELIYYVTHPDGRQERLVQAYPMRYFFRFEAEHLLVRSGFEIEAVYADFDKSPYGSKYPEELIFVAKKVDKS